MGANNDDRMRTMELGRKESIEAAEWEREREGVFVFLPIN